MNYLDVHIELRYNSIYTTESTKNHSTRTNIHSTPQTSHYQGKTALLAESALNIYVYVARNWIFAWWNVSSHFVSEITVIYHFTTIALWIKLSGMIVQNTTLLTNQTQQYPSTFALHIATILWKANTYITHSLNIKTRYPHLQTNKPLICWKTQHKLKLYTIKADHQKFNKDEENPWKKIKFSSFPVSIYK